MSDSVQVTYGLAQCAISFIFISRSVSTTLKTSIFMHFHAVSCISTGRVLKRRGFFYNNLSFARMRPALRQMLRQQQEKLARAARALM